MASVTICSDFGGGDLVTKLCLILVTPWTLACQAPLSIRFSGQAYWSGLSFPFPGHLPDPAIQPGPHALQENSFPTDQYGKDAMILESPKIKSLTVFIVSPSICHEVMGLDTMIFIF